MIEDRNRLEKLIKEEVESALDGVTNQAAENVIIMLSDCSPDDIFSEADLESWAENNGWKKADE